MSQKKVIIIGAGITGLCAGINLKKAGFDTEIFEMHSLPGGMCTAWSRKGYTFDGCMDWLLGSSPDGYFHNMWREVGAIDDTTKAIEYDIFTEIELSSGKNFKVYTDPDKLRKEMIELAPGDSKEINKLIGLVKTFSKMNFPNNFWDMLKLVPFALANMGDAIRLRKLFSIDVKDYLQNFNNPELKEALAESFDANICAIAFVMMLGYMARKSAGFILGGSLEFAKRIEQKYISLGGIVHYNSQVIQIITEEDKVDGIRLANGDVHLADYIVSAADGYDTIFRMLKGRYTSPIIGEAYSTWAIFPGIVQVSLGVAKEFNNEPPNLNFILKNKITIDTKSIASRINVQIFNFDPTLAPAGKTALTLMHLADYEYWSTLRVNNKEEYNKQKDRIAQETIDALDIRFPGLKEKVEVVDVATPATYERYNNEWKGSWEGFWPSAVQIRKSLPSTLPGLNNFWMAGQWLKPGGGLPTALMEGKRVCRDICKTVKKK